VVTHEVLFLGVGVDGQSYVVRYIRSRPVRKGGVSRNLGRISATAMEASDGGAVGLNAQDERLIEGSRNRKRNTLGGKFPQSWIFHDRLGSDAHEDVVRLLGSGGGVDWRIRKRWELGPVIAASLLRRALTVPATSSKARNERGAQSSTSSRKRRDGAVIRLFLAAHLAEFQIYSNSLPVDVDS
jgi:hypothetical protein